MNTKTKRGGKRKGAGRPVTGNRKQPAYLKMSPDVVAWIRTHDNMSVEVETILRRCAAFKAWKRAQ